MSTLPPGLAVSGGTSVDNVTGTWRTERPRFLLATCTGCNLCVVFCPEGIVRMTAPKRYDFDATYCKGCGICAAECPVNDIVMEPEER